LQCLGSAACISIMSEASAWYSLARLDPTANLGMVEFLLRVPDDQFYRQGQRSFLIQCAFRNRLPESVLCGKRKGLQAADVARDQLGDVLWLEVEVRRHGRQ
jgi:hypothetical protein